ncbi:LutC/YkgG family protein [Sphingobacterium hotanense]|uniref:LUD domain-containing protein n=1 Tax=Sphingobacterium hotanense TaxID=649196 RepID=A0ABT7NM58_9SPHI|nr:LUD domain-containing protein [Sphingobacterium hotanense]MCT1525972.1 LUD domain-containing protein [Sphingobacterium hotanense]MDM1048339.1 LUD domain-containing protein [Sphingobacterium hotanense]
MNIRNTTAKEKMLKKIRQALLQKRENPNPAFEDSPLYKDEEDPLDVTFAREFTNVAGQFVYCDGEINLIENLIILLEKLKLTKLYVWDKNLQKFLDQYGFPYHKHRTDFDDIEVGVTACEALIARNGSILISNADASGRRLSVYPPVHIVIAKTSQLVMDIKHGMALMREKYGNDLPSMITTITGPSRTADIEKMLVLGAHGPKELYLLLLEDRF